MGGSGSAKRMRHLENLPDDLMHVIFYRLDFRDKVSAGLVCKHWDQLLKIGSAAGRHWVVDYNVNRLVSKSASLYSNNEAAGEEMLVAMERCVTVLASFSQCTKHPPLCKCNKITCLF
jgi:hypothetical protein